LIKIFFICNSIEDDPSLKKGVGSGAGSGSGSQRYGSAYPDMFQNVTDQEHWEIMQITVEKKNY
jgi:hypothetical protein